RFFDGVETSKKHTATVSARIKCTPLKFLFMRVAPKRVGRFFRMYVVGADHGVGPQAIATYFGCGAVRRYDKRCQREKRRW
ncbi:hypothetical protein, partial [Caballeronia sp. M23-90]